MHTTAQPWGNVDRRGSGRQLVGREDQRRQLSELLDSTEPAVTGTILYGDAGIGKTAIWEWTVVEAMRRAGRTLVSRAGPAEARLPWVGLTDLLRGVPSDTFAGVPAPQLTALRVIMLEAIADVPLDERTVGTAMWTLLSALASAAPVTIALDDLSYLDAASGAALGFALRRLAPVHPVRVMATARDPRESAAPFDALAPDQVYRMDVGPMSLGAIYELLAVRLAARIARPTLVRVHEAAGGNPLYALELARSLQRREIVPTPGAPLPVPGGLEALVRERVRALPPAILEIVAATAATWRFTDAGLDPEALRIAEQSGVVIVEDHVIRSMHPLLGAAAYNALTPERRRALHERLAVGASEIVERARHAALAATAPDDEVARTVDVGVRAAISAGTPDIAVELGRLALTHTTMDTDRSNRLDALADALMRTGDTEGALAAANEAVTLTDAGPARARRRIRAAEIMTEVTGWDNVIPELHVALVDAGPDPVVRAEVLLTLAAITNDIERTDEYSREAVALLEACPDPDPRIMSGALAQAAGARFRAGRGLDHEAHERAMAIERAHPMRRLSDRADAGYAALLKYADELDRAEPMLLTLLDEARASGDLSSMAYALAHLPQIPLWRGDLARAERYANEHLALAEQAGLFSQVGQAHVNLGWVHAYQGRLDDAATTFAAPLAGETTTPFESQRAHAGLGFVELSRGNASAAATHMGCWHAHLTEMHWREPGYSRGHLDYLVSHVSTGALDEAAAFVAHTTELADRSGRRSTAIVATVGRALIDAATGRLAEAQEGIGLAVTAYNSMPLRFDRARTLFLAGRIHRRAKAKGLARDALTEARDEFSRFGAVAWLALTNAELARVNLRPSAPATLTETERRIAELTSTGLTNREVAQHMFLAARTVEANLARIYRKLGIRSRAELGLRLAAEQRRGAADQGRGDDGRADPIASTSAVTPGAVSPGQ